jgi:hypothetical protein
LPAVIILAAKYRRWRDKGEGLGFRFLGSGMVYTSDAKREDAKEGEGQGWGFGLKDAVQ